MRMKYPLHIHYALYEKKTYLFVIVVLDCMEEIPNVLDICSVCILYYVQTLVVAVFRYAWRNYDFMITYTVMGHICSFFLRSFPFRYFTVFLFVNMQTSTQRKAEIRVKFDFVSFNEHYRAKQVVYYANRNVIRVKIMRSILIANYYLEFKKYTLNLKLKKYTF